MLLELIMEMLRHQFAKDTRYLDIHIIPHDNGTQVRVTTEYPPDHWKVRVTIFEYTPNTTNGDGDWTTTNTYTTDNYED